MDGLVYVGTRTRVSANHELVFSDNDYAAINVETLGWVVWFHKDIFDLDPREPSGRDTTIVACCEDARNGSVPVDRVK